MFDSRWKMRFTAALIAPVLVLLVATGTPQGQAQAPATSSQDVPIALVGGTLIDGVSDRVVRNAVVLVRGGRIERVGAVGELSVPPSYRQIDTDGHTVMPGLWDITFTCCTPGTPIFSHGIRGIPRGLSATSCRRPPGRC